MNRSQRQGPEQWRQIMEGQRSSGLTVGAYCRQRGITESSFYTWKRRLRWPAPGFVEVKHPDTPMAGALELILPGDRRLLVRRGFDRELLIELIRTLEAVA